MSLTNALRAHGKLIYPGDSYHSKCKSLTIDGVKYESGSFGWLYRMLYGALEPQGGLRLLIVEWDPFPIPNRDTGAPLIVGSGIVVGKPRAKRVYRIMPSGRKKAAYLGSFEFQYWMLYGGLER